MNSFSTEPGYIRKVGLAMLCIFGGLALFGFWRGNLFPVCFFGFLSFLGVAFSCLPKLMKPVFAAWMRAGHAIGMVLTTILLSLAYYLVVTPSALIRRMTGGKLIATKPDPDAASYWVARDEKVQPRERFHKRY